MYKPEEYKNQLSTKLWHLHQFLEDALLTSKNLLSYCSYKKKEAQEHPDGGGENGYGYPLDLSGRLEEALTAIQKETWDIMRDAERAERENEEDPGAANIRTEPPSNPDEAPEDDQEYDYEEFPDLEQYSLIKEDEPAGLAEETPEERPEVFLGGYVLPFAYKINWNEAWFDDQSGRAFTIKGNNDFRLTETVHGILLDKLRDILNGKAYDLDEFPKIYIRIQSDNIYINDMEIVIEKRTGPEGYVHDELKKFLYRTLCDEDINKLYAAARIQNFEGEEIDDLIFRYNTGKYPIYDYQSPQKYWMTKKTTLESNLYELRRLFFLEIVMSKEPVALKKIYDAITTFYQMDPDEQASTEKIVSTGAAINDAIGKKDAENDRIIGLKLGVYSEKYDIFFETAAAWKEWKRNNLLQEDDILVGKTDWSGGTYLVETYGQMEDVDQKTFKCRCDTGDGPEKYKIKFHAGNYAGYYGNKAVSTIKQYYEANREMLGPIRDERIRMPLPFTEESKNRQQMTEWMRANLALLGYDLTKTKVNDFLRNYSYYRKDNDKEDKKFRRTFRKLLFELLENNPGAIFDRTLKPGPQKKEDIPDTIIDGIIETLP